VLYGHVFRNAMLIIIAGFPGAFISAFFTGSLLIETIFSLDGLGLLGFESIIQPRLSGRLRHALHLLADGPRRRAAVRPSSICWVDPRIDFEAGRPDPWMHRATADRPTPSQ
jgi:microcin C transport system permease protein